MNIAGIARSSAGARPAWQRVPRDRDGATTRTTLGLDADLLAAIDDEILRGAARNRSELVNAAVLAELRRREAAAVDAAFRSMAADSEYLAEIRGIEAEFASADLESWNQIEPVAGVPSE